MPCKIVGCIGFGGLGAYSFYQVQQLPKNLVARRLGLGLMGTGKDARSSSPPLVSLLQGVENKPWLLFLTLLSYYGTACWG